MKQLHPSNLEAHNRVQRSYFERILKQTMVPRDTPYLRRHVDELLRFAGISASDRLLEVGCGMGRYTLLLAERGVRVEGLDLSPVLLERLREFDGGRHDVPLYSGDVLNHPPELDGQFDVVLGLFTLHHLHDLSRCFEAMARFLKPGGRLVFLEPNPYNPLYYLQILITPGMTWQGDGGMVRMRRAIIRRAMEQAGLGSFVVRRFGFFPPFLTNQAWGRRFERVLERVPLWRALLPFQLFRGERLR